MAKDYAKYHVQKKQDSLVKEGLFKRLLLVLVGFLLISAALASLYLYKKNQSALHHFVVHVQGWLVSGRSAEVVQNKPVEKPQEPEIHFDFYTELPNMQVTVPAPVSVKHQETFTLQLGLFKNKTDASEQRISLLLSGLEADIVKTAGGYLVTYGLFANVPEAKEMQNQLKQRGFQSVIKKV